MTTIDITKENYKAIKQLYSTAVANGAKQFSYNGQEVVTAYAKYLLEHMENVLQIKPKKK